MNVHRIFAAAALLSASLLLSACQTGPSQSAAEPAPANPGLCDRAAAEALAGRKRVSDDEARKLTGATVVRQIAPNSPVTMDFRQERVTIETDPATDMISRAYCG